MIPDTLEELGIGSVSPAWNGLLCPNELELQPVTNSLNLRSLGRGFSRDKRVSVRMKRGQKALRAFVSIAVGTFRQALAGCVSWSFKCLGDPAEVVV